MGRYTIYDNFEDRSLNREEIRVSDEEFDTNVVLYNTYYRSHDEDKPIRYIQDRCVNRYDLNKDFLNEIIKNGASSMLWIIDPKFVTLEMAIELAKLGKGEYIPYGYRSMWEIAVLRYASGERDFFDQIAYFDSSDFYTLDRLINDAEYASSDIEDYVYNFTLENEGYMDRDKIEYILEERRRNFEVNKARRLLKR